MSISPLPQPICRRPPASSSTRPHQRGQKYPTIVADADARKVVHVSKGASADNVAGFESL
jgi:hypothetical protein